jgi:hypothetical protein
MTFIDPNQQRNIMFFPKYYVLYGIDGVALNS